MLDLAQGVRAQIIKETAPKVAAKKPFTLQALRAAIFWGGAAAAALALAVLSMRGNVGTERLAAIFAASRPPVTAPKFDAEAETRRLADAVRNLAIDNERLKSRLAAVEHNMEDVTGSVGKQIEAADAARRAAEGPTVANTASVTVATMTADLSAPASAPTMAGGSAAPAAAPSQSLQDIAPALQPQIAYGVDIGSGLTIQTLRLRWNALRTAHAQLFAGLEPIVSVRETPRANRVELRLVVGPLPEAGAAQELCASLVPFGLFCQPTMYDGQRLSAR